MKKTEFILIILFLLANVLRILNITGGVALLYLSVMLLELQYLLFSFAILNRIRFRDILKKQSYKNSSPITIAGSVAAGLIFTILIHGILYKILFWRGAAGFLYTGIAASAAVIIYAALLTGSVQHKKEIIRRGTVLISIGILLLMTPTSALIGFYFRNDPEVGEIRLRMYNDPENREIHKEYDELINKRDKQRFAE